MEPQVQVEVQEFETTAAVEEEAVEKAAQEEGLNPGHYKITTGGKVKSGPRKDQDGKVTYTIDLGYDLVDSGEKFGQDVVYKNYISGARVKAGGFARAQIESGADPAAIQSFMENTWNPGYKAGGIVDPVASGRDAINRLSDADLAALLAERGIEI